MPTFYDGSSYLEIPDTGSKQPEVLIYLKEKIKFNKITLRLSIKNSFIDFKKWPIYININENEIHRVDNFFLKYPPIIPEILWYRREYIWKGVTFDEETIGIIKNISEMINWYDYIKNDRPEKIADIIIRKDYNSEILHEFNIDVPGFKKSIVRKYLENMPVGSHIFYGYKGDSYFEKKEVGYSNCYSKYSKDYAESELFKWVDNLNSCYKKYKKSKNLLDDEFKFWEDRPKEPNSF